MCIIMRSWQGESAKGLEVGGRGRDDQWMTLQMSAVSDAAAHGHGPRGAEGARDGSRDTCEPIMSNGACVTDAGREECRV
jgi:hypothetical protein